MPNHRTQHLFIVRTRANCWIFDPRKLHFQFEKGRFFKREDWEVLRGNGPEQFAKVARRSRMLICPEDVQRLESFDVVINRRFGREYRLSVRPLLIDVNSALNRVTGLINFDGLDEKLRSGVVMPDFPAITAPKTAAE